MTDDDSTLIDRVIPAELQQRLPRKTRVAARGIYYLVGSFVISIFLLAFAAMALRKTARDVRNGRELARDGLLAYTGDVQSGGMHLATVYYTFNFDGRLYRGEAALPPKYLNKINDYSRSRNFAVLFLPRDPSINHPYDWQDDESYSFSLIAYVLIAIAMIQWAVLGKFILRDRQLARNGVAAVGSVTKCSYGRNGGILVRYEFRDTEGLLTEGHGEYPARRERDEQICVLYLPEESEKSRPYPLVFFRAVS